MPANSGLNYTKHGSAPERRNAAKLGMPAGLAPPLMAHRRPAQGASPEDSDHARGRDVTTDGLGHDWRRLLTFLDDRYGPKPSRTDFGLKELAQDAREGSGRVPALAARRLLKKVHCPPTPSLSFALLETCSKVLLKAVWRLLALIRTSLHPPTRLHNYPCLVCS